jgi:hypothetical protein
MYSKAPIDQNMVRQGWFRKMQPFHASLLQWSFYYMTDSIGVLDPDAMMEDFYQKWKGFLSDGDINLHEFVEDCNNDKKERMIWLDKGRKLWFAPTVIFRNSDNHGFRRMVNNQRDASILRSLSNREETKTWFIEQSIYNDRLEVGKELIVSVHNAEKATRNQMEFMQTIAKKMGFKIPKGKHSPDSIKERYGCQCQYCGEVFPKSQLEVEHVVPRSSRKKEVEYVWNKVPACQKCNEEKDDLNVFVFLKMKGFDLLTGVKIAVDKWVKRGVLEYPTQYGDKRNIKEKTYTWNQVTTWVSNNPDSKTSDYECMNPESEVIDRRWRKKKINS